VVRPGRRTREERETVIRFDETGDPAYLWTASPAQARRWERAGVALVQRGGGWKGRAPKEAVNRCRRVIDGRLVKQKPRGAAASALARAMSEANADTQASQQPDENGRREDALARDTFDPNE
jgi:hypothetical protein